MRLALLTVLVLVGVSVRAETLEGVDITIIPPSDLVYSASPKTFYATSTKTTDLSIHYLGRGATLYSNAVPPSKAGEYAVVVSSLDPNYVGTKSQNFEILRKQIDPTVLSGVRSLYNGTTAVQTIWLNIRPEGVIFGDDVAIQTSPYNHQFSFASGWTGVFDSVGPSIEPGDIWATITGLSLVGGDAENYSLPPSIRMQGTINPSYLSWIESTGLTGPNAAKDADPDGDGITNAAEFVFAGDPHSPGGNLITSESTSQGFKLRWLTRNHNGYGWMVLAKTDLTSPWQQVGDSEKDGWSYNWYPHPTRSDASMNEVIIPWESPYRFFKIGADVYDIDDPTQA